jgi:hypothetical protein
MTKPEGFWFDTGQVLRTWNGGKGEGTSASHLEQELLRNLDRFVGSVGKGDKCFALGTSSLRTRNKSIKGL